MIVLTWLRGLLRRRKARIAGETLGIALVTVMLSALGAFFSASRADMTQGAVAAVPVDWQVQLAPGTDIGSAISTIEHVPGVRTAVAVGTARTPAFTARTSGSVQTTGSGVVLGMPTDYAATFPGEIRFLVGSHDGVLLAQQTAANLHVTVGSVISVARPGLPQVSERVTGIVDLPFADTLFQTVGASTGSATAPPDNVLLVPLATWHRLFDDVSSGTATQVHVGLDPNVPLDPNAAFADVVARAKNVEAALAGSGVVGNNIGAQLDATRSDATYAELLFAFLGLPGVFLAIVFAGVVANTGRERRRLEQALLRARGGTTSTILALAGVEAALVAAIGGALGLAAAIVETHVAFGSRSSIATGVPARWSVAAALTGLAVAAAVIVVPAWRDQRTLTVRTAQATGATKSPRPLWSRLYLDAVLLVAGGTVYWRAVRSGYQVVIAPEGVPTISVDTFTLLAPLFFWVGAALLTWRLAAGALTRGRKVLALMSRPVAHGLAGVVAAAMSRQRRLLSRGLVFVALTTTFAVSVSVFNVTYADQARVDAQLTNGADVSVQTSAGDLEGLPPSLLPATATLPGVGAVEPMLHRYAYVGNDLQDLYGIDPATISRATPMPDAYFTGASAADVLGRLAATRNGALVSEETVHDYQLHLHDLVRLRMQTADGAYHVVPFRYVGVVREFPTAPHDSFIVANRGYVAEKTGSSAVETMLVRTTGSPIAVADEIRGVVGPAPGARVTDIVTQQRATLSSLSAIDLRGLTRLELAFALVLTVAASGIVLALGIGERRKTFAIAVALGARPRQVGAFVWSESVFVTIGGLLLGALAGCGLAYVIVKILTGVFDPPPSGLSIPWLYLAAFMTTTVVAVGAAAIGTLRVLGRATSDAVRGL